MFDSIKSKMKKREEDALRKGIQNRLRLSRNEVLRRKDRVDHEIKKLENEIEGIMTRAENLKSEGRIKDAVRLVYEAQEKDKAAGSLYKSLETLSVYDSTLSLMSTRLLAKDSVVRSTKKDGILSTDTQQMIQRLATLESREDSYESGVDMAHLEGLLDSPIYNPASHNNDYLATKSGIESMVAQSPTFERYLGSFKSDLVPTKDR